MRDWHWNWKQALVIDSDRPFIDFEGALRSGKSYAAHFRVVRHITRYPGAHVLLSRWGDDDTRTELAPRWRKFAAFCGLTLQWDRDEQADRVVGFDSLVYLKGLRTSESSARYAALRGLDLSAFHLEQAEEYPRDFWGEIVGRLSQKDMPHWGMITPQPVPYDHWITEEFPETNTKPTHLYVSTSTYDNRANVGEAYLAQQEAMYPEGSAQRRSLLLGLRGLNSDGVPVYAGYFNRAKHLAPVTLDPYTPLVEAWDFGHGHPAVVWMQFTALGRLQVLGVVQGKDLYLEDFAPLVAQWRNRWCPNPMAIDGIGDPMGLDVTNDGAQVTRVREVLATIGSFPISQPHANQPAVRNQAIQAISGYMRRDALDGRPAFLVNPRAVEISRQGAHEHPFFADALEGGYVWDTRQFIGPTSTIRRPKKDGFFDHACNGLEYGVLGYGSVVVTDQDVEKVRAAQLREAQRDYDPADDNYVSLASNGRRGYRNGRSTTSRGGY